VYFESVPQPWVDGWMDGLVKIGRVSPKIKGVLIGNIIDASSNSS
jgi:hypothetical protein